MKLKKLVLALLAASLILPAALVAQETTIDPYATVRLWTGYDHLSEDVPSAGGDSDTQINYYLPAINVFGFDLGTDKIDGKLEIGMKDDNSLYLRHAFITYTVNDLELLIGQTGSPYTVVSGQQARGDFLNLGYGSAFDGRNPQIKLTYQNAYIAFIEPKAKANYDSLTPKTAAGYNYTGQFGANTLKLGFGGALQVLTHDNVDNIISYLAYFNGNISGNGMFFKFNATYGQNTGDMGMLNNGVLVTAPDLTNSQISEEDTAVIEGFVELGFQLTSIATLSGSVGYIQSDNDSLAETERQIAYAAQCSFAIEDNFTITPAVLYRDFMDDSAGIDQGYDIYGGLSFVATFK